MTTFLSLILGVPLLIVASFFLVGAVLSGPRYRGPVTDHFDGKKFINPGGFQAKGLREVLKWAVNRERQPWAYRDVPFGEKPINQVNAGVRVTFINHTTFLIQGGGVNLLTDPVWSERTSPFSFAGPRRMRNPGIRMEDLPAIDYVLLSHNHYDHLDTNALRQLDKVHEPHVITPLGVQALLQTKGIAGAGDLDWWDEKMLTSRVKVQALPAQHFSGRGMLDRDASLWCGYMITIDGLNIYFAGDTGYNDATFKDIGKRTGPVDLSIIPIGAYKPEWFMSPIHVSPYNAVRIHLEVKSNLSVPSHYGTFPLADDGLDEPVNDLRAALRQLGVDESAFQIVPEGKYIEIGARSDLRIG
ncbi:MAG: MBL fold metallo-hydrolase [Bacteroidia bacterium]|nr:MBL fold metallo-hydrolase [Bacteroidia bacterium]